MRKILLLSFIVAFSLQMGCSKDPNRPADLPKLYSCSITITQDGKPLEEATVTLVSKTPAKFGTGTATTDASGTATLKTYGYNGIPLGQYKVLIEKRGVEGARESKNEYGDTIQVGGTIYQYVDAQYVSERSTPFEIDITEKGGKETFEVGAPVRILLGRLGG